jgi:uncharacterized protein YfaS (alpha-2-macroglobulin family)
MKRYLWAGLIISFLFLGVSEGADPPRVVSFSPQGYVKGVRQVKVRFSHPMIAFGDPRSALAPFEITCPVKGQGRWVDSRIWVYDFEGDLPGGLRCEFRLMKGLKTLGGERMEGRRSFSFNTGGPAVKEVYPYEGSRNIDEEQVFILTLDAEVEYESLLKHAAFFVEGIEGPIGIRVIDGTEREVVLRERYRWSNRPHDPLLLIGCRQRFPSEKGVRLVWGKGICSKTKIPLDKDQVFSFRTRPLFRADFRCSKEKASSPCLPLLPMKLSFTTPIPVEKAKAITLRSSDGKLWTAEDIDDTEVNELKFRGPFPEHSDFLLEIPSDLEDDSGRRLSNAYMFPLRIKTGGNPPLAKFPSRFSIVELAGEKMLPVTVRNLEAEIRGASLRIGESFQVLTSLTGKVERIAPSDPSGIQAALRRVASAKRDRSMFSEKDPVRLFKMPKTTKELEVMGIPFEGSGLYLIELESTVLGESLLGSSRPAYVPAAALVTNMSVHFKWGRESSLVWVTTLDKGEPVKGALVTVHDCMERVIWKGETDAQGLAMIAAPLPPYEALPVCHYEADYRDYPQMGPLSGLSGGLFIVAKTSDDISFVHSSWDRGIEAFRFNLPEGEPSSGLIGHTILDRTLLRAGETVHMKHIIRRHTGGGLVLPPQEDLPDTLSISHGGSGQVFEIPLSWDKAGCSLSSWEIPREAKLGTYFLNLTRKAGGYRNPPQGSGTLPSRGEPTQGVREISIRSGSFRVEEFRVPLLRTMIRTPAEPLVLPKEVSVHIGVDYVAGGPAKGLPFKLRSVLREMTPPSVEGFEGFIFSNGMIKEGEVARGEEEEGRVEPDSSPRVREGRLDEGGTALLSLDGFTALDSPKDLFLELEYRDPNGEVQTSSSQVKIWNGAMLLGISPTSWAVSGERFGVRLAALDLAGRPLEGVTVSLSLFERRFFSHRKRLLGGFYSFEHREEIRALGRLGGGKTDANGILSFEAVSPVSGNVIILAEACDKEGKRVFAHAEVWISKKDRWWFDARDHDRIDLIPDKRRYEPGESAIFQVRAPFAEAWALVTVEREGIIQAEVRRISGERPIIELPIKGSFAPNIFVSVLAVRGRIQDVQPTAMADMGRPSYKLGIAEIAVGWAEHELKVSLVPEKSVFKVREKARVRIRARKADGLAPPSGSEAALAAVDEGLLELAPNKSWDLLSAMMGRRGYEVQTATAQMEVVGRRHYGLKALPPGGGGGRRPTRELFETLLAWQGRVYLDERGEADIEIPLNDSITGFRIAAVVSGGAGLFGTGLCTIRSTQDLVIISGLSPLVRETDLFKAEFTIRNASERKVKALVHAKNDLPSKTLEPVAVELQPGASEVVGWDVSVPRGRTSITWEIEAVDRDSAYADRLKATQRVVPAVPTRTFQATITRIEKETVLTVAKPPDAERNAGGIVVDLMASIASGLEPVREFMEVYPYTCLEQKVSIAVALRDQNAWRTLMGQLPAYLDQDGLARYFPSSQKGSVELTSYILSIATEAGWSLPAEAVRRMKEGLKNFVEGRIRRDSVVPLADLAVRRLAAMDALSRIGALDKKHLGSITVEPGLWPTSALLDWIGILIREKTWPKRGLLLKEAQEVLRSRFDLQGSAMTLSSAGRSPLWWLMVSDDVASVKALITVMQLEDWREDIPRMVRGALLRQKGGRWDLTVANAWGVLAMERFSNAFESEQVEGLSRIALGDRSVVKDWTHPASSIAFPWGEGSQDLILTHTGNGVPWAVVRSRAAIPLTRAVSSGYRIKKVLMPVERRQEGHWSKGDVVRVRLEMDSQADQTWVVVADPVPSGASILGTGLGRDSLILTGGEKQEGWAWPSYEERSLEAFRAYYEFVPKGRWALEYTIRLNQSGLFQMPPTRVEALYLPEMMGEIPNSPLEVRP